MYHFCSYVFSAACLQYRSSPDYYVKNCCTERLLLLDWKALTTTTGKGRDSLLCIVHNMLVCNKGRLCICVCVHTLCQHCPWCGTLPSCSGFSGPTQKQQYSSFTGIPELDGGSQNSSLLFTCRGMKVDSIFSLCLSVSVSLSLSLSCAHEHTHTIYIHAYSLSHTNTRTT